MSMTKRVWLFVFGAILGSIIMYFFVMKDRNIYVGPESIILTKIKEGNAQISKHAKCKMECLGISTADIKELVDNGDVDFSASDVHGKPCKSYIINNEVEAAKAVQATFQFCDTMIVLNDLQSRIKQECNCQ